MQKTNRALCCPTVKELRVAIGLAKELIHNGEDFVIGTAYIGDNYIYSNAVYDLVVENNMVILKTIQIDPDEALDGIAILPDVTDEHWSVHAELLMSLHLMTTQEVAAALDQLETQFCENLVMIEAMVDQSMDDTQQDLPAKTITLRGVCGKLPDTAELIYRDQEIGGGTFFVRCYSTNEDISNALANNTLTPCRAKQALQALNLYLDPL